VTRRRLDAELVRRGLADDDAQAAAAVRDGRVLVAGMPATSPGTMVGADDPVLLREAGPRYVSRGGDKLRAALDRFAIDVAGATCLDAGASTGGFTDCLLQAGAGSVTAVDVGYGQLAWHLREDPRVRVVERTNIRDLRPGDLPAPDVVVADLSFVSLRTVLPGLHGLAHPGAGYVLLAKPQFEASSDAVEPGGVVRDPAVRRAAVRDVVGAAAELGIALLGVMASPLRGPAGNVEFLLYGRDGATATCGDADVEAAIAEGEALG